MSPFYNNSINCNLPKCITYMMTDQIFHKEQHQAHDRQTEPDQSFHTVLHKTVNTRQVKSKDRSGRRAAAICGLSMAGLFTLLGELGCQHWTSCVPNTTVGNDKTPLCLFLLYLCCHIPVCILLFIFLKTPEGYLIIAHKLCHAESMHI